VKRKPFGILRHACIMVQRKIRSYVSLSVTIILSFSLLLGYMGYTDSEHYNAYKHRFSTDRGLLTFYSRNLSPTRLSQIQEKAATYGTTNSTQNLFIGITIRLSNAKLTTGEPFLGSINARAYCLPRECWFLQKDESIGSLQNIEPVWLDGRKSANITLEKGQILMDEQLFKALGCDENNKLTLTFTCNNLQAAMNPGIQPTKVSGIFTVVGTVPSDTPMEVSVEENPETGEKTAVISNNGEYCPKIVFSLDDLNPDTHPSVDWRRSVIFHSTQPESVYQLIQSMEPSVSVNAIFTGQDKALETLQTEKGIKAIIAIMMLLILGINLYSGFQNALNDRKFEIGVKRAMGASAFCIVRQFFYESMLVMIANIAVTVALVVDIGLVLKLYREANYITRIDEKTISINYAYQDYVLYITAESVAMFAVCALVLTVVFSFIFAYKATRVQIVDYLKAE